MLRNYIMYISQELASTAQIEQVICKALQSDYQTAYYLLHN